MSVNCNGLRYTACCRHELMQLSIMDNPRQPRLTALTWPVSLSDSPDWLHSRDRCHSPTAPTDCTHVTSATLRQPRLTALAWPVPLSHSPDWLLSRDRSHSLTAPTDCSHVTGATLPQPWLTALAWPVPLSHSPDWLLSRDRRHSPTAPTDCTHVTAATTRRCEATKEIAFKVHYFQLQILLSCDEFSWSDKIEYSLLNCSIKNNFNCN